MVVKKMKAEQGKKCENKINKEERKWGKGFLQKKCHKNCKNKIARKNVEITVGRIN